MAFIIKLINNIKIQCYNTAYLNEYYFYYYLSKYKQAINNLTKHYYFNNT